MSLRNLEFHHAQFFPIQFLITQSWPSSCVARKPTVSRSECTLISAQLWERMSPISCSLPLGVLCRSLQEYSRNQNNTISQRLLKLKESPRKLSTEVIWMYLQILRLLNFLKNFQIIRYLLLCKYSAAHTSQYFCQSSTFKLKLSTSSCKKNLMAQNYRTRRFNGFRCRHWQKPNSQVNT